MSNKTNQKFITKAILNESYKAAFLKLKPNYMMKNPVMFVVEIGNCNFKYFSKFIWKTSRRHGDL